MIGPIAKIPNLISFAPFLPSQRRYLCRSSHRLAIAASPALTSSPSPLLHRLSPSPSPLSLSPPACALSAAGVSLLTHLKFRLLLPLRLSDCPVLDSLSLALFPPSSASLSLPSPFSGRRPLLYLACSCSGDVLLLENEEEIGRSRTCFHGNIHCFSSHLLPLATSTPSFSFLHRSQSQILSEISHLHFLSLSCQAGVIVARKGDNPPMMPAVVTPEGPLDLSSVLFRNRIIFIGQQINSQVAQRVISQLVTLAAIDEDADIVIKPKVGTVCFGIAASHGAFLLAAGEKGMRFAMPNARVMIHQPHTGLQGHVEDVRRQINEGLHSRHVSFSPRA
ncbi:hypothetical protein ACLOJK_003557 [Asimina triloba]